MAQLLLKTQEEKKVIKHLYTDMPHCVESQQAC